jgi:hypothetical protein
MRIAGASLLALVLPLAAGATARAGGGVLEINQACAEVGCFEGDSPGFPVSASSAGSYVLTGNLTVPDADTTAVTLGTGASLDLGGFTIGGPASCTGTPAACTGTGNGVGVSAAGQTAVRNGRIEGMGNMGISAAENMHVSDVTIYGNGAHGIIAGGGMLIERCVIDRNGADGINMSAGQVGATVIQNNAIHRNHDAGVRAPIAIVKDNGFKQNGSYGFVGTSAALSGNNFYNNNGVFGDSFSGGVETGENVCDGSLTCP